MTVLCAFAPPIIFDVSNCGDNKEFYKEWLMKKLIELESLSMHGIQEKAFEFWKHLIEDSTLVRDLLWVKMDKVFLEYFHYKNELLFKKDIFYVKKSHQDKYSLSVKTKFGTIEQKFSSIRECKDATGLELRNNLRKILYK